MHGYWRTIAQSTHCDVRKRLFGVHTMAENILGFKFSKNRQKWPFCWHVQAAMNGFETNDVIEDRRHGLQSLGGRAAYTIYSIMGITSVLYFPLITTQRLCQLVHYIRYGNSVFTVFVGNLFYMLAHKKIPYAVCWKASITSKTLIRKRQTLHKLCTN